MATENKHDSIKESLLDLLDSLSVPKKDRKDHAAFRAIIADKEFPPTEEILQKILRTLELYFIPRNRIFNDAKNQKTLKDHLEEIYQLYDTQRRLRQGGPH